MFLFLFIFCIIAIPVTLTCEEGNCTEDVTKHYILEEHHSRSNLAWLVTPALFALGVCYLIYKCCKDGLCNCRRLRERAAQEQQEEGYFPLNEVALMSSSQIPYVPPSVTSRSGAHPLLFIHNQTFCVALDPRRARNGHGRSATGSSVPLIHPPPSYQEALLHGDGTYITQPEVVTNPPSYISSNPPRYSVAIGEESLHSSMSDDIDEPDVVVVSETTIPARQLKFLSNRRRHRSAQDAHMKQERHRHSSAQDRRASVQNGEDDSINRQRCFSFNALKDAFKNRSQQNVVPAECQSLLRQDEMNNFSPILPGRSTRRHSHQESSRSKGVTYVTTSGITTTTRVHRRSPQQVSFQDRILEGSESSENVEGALNESTDTYSSSPQRLRHRHFSAPDSIELKSKKLRHSSGNS